MATTHKDGTISIRWNKATWRIVLRSMDAFSSETIADEFGEPGAMRAAQAREELARELRK